MVCSGSKEGKSRKGKCCGSGSKEGKSRKGKGCVVVARKVKVGRESGV